MVSRIPEAISVPFRCISPPPRHDGNISLHIRLSCRQARTWAATRGRRRAWIQSHRFQELESQLESGGAPETPPRLCPAVTTPTPSRSVTRHGPQQALGSGGRQDDSRRDEEWQDIADEAGAEQGGPGQPQSPGMTSAERSRPAAPVSSGGHGR